MSMNVKFFTQTDNDLLFGEMIEEAPIPQFNWATSSRIINSPDPIQQCVDEMESLAVRFGSENLYYNQSAIYEFLTWVEEKKNNKNTIFVDMF